MQTTFKTLGNLIDNAIETHRKAASLYKAVGKLASDPRCQMLLDDMIDNEDRMANLFAEFVTRANPGTLNTQLQFTLEEDPHRFIQTVTPTTDTVSLEQVSQLGQDLHLYMINLIEGALREVSAEV